MLYQLSYFRIILWEEVDSNHRTLRERIYSPPQLPLCEPPSVFPFEPIEGFEPTTPRLQITCSGQLSYIGKLIRILQSRKGLQR